MYGIVCQSMLLKHLILTYLRLVWINFGLIKILNIYGKLIHPRPEVDQEYYVITIMKLFRTWHFEADRGLAWVRVSTLCCSVISIQRNFPWLLTHKAKICIRLGLSDTNCYTLWMNTLWSEQLVIELTCTREHACRRRSMHQKFNSYSKYQSYAKGKAIALTDRRRELQSDVSVDDLLARELISHVDQWPTADWQI